MWLKRAGTQTNSSPPRKLNLTLCISNKGPQEQLLKLQLLQELQQEAVRLLTRSIWRVATSKGLAARILRVAWNLSWWVNSKIINLKRERLLAKCRLMSLNPYNNKLLSLLTNNISWLWSTCRGCLKRRISQAWPPCPRTMPTWHPCCRNSKRVSTYYEIFIKLVYRKCKSCHS